MKKRIILASDIHLCDYNWYGMRAEDRVQRFVDDLKAEYEKHPFEALLLLGDYSLDHFCFNILGSYLTRGVSNTKRFVDEYLSQLKELPIEVRMIAGNHEMYGNELFHELTGYNRRDIYVTGDLLFILMDTYRAGLDPTEHIDGVYTGADIAFIKEQMAAYPDKRVILCSHYLEHWKEPEEFKEILRSGRVICMVQGHTHKSEVWHNEEEYGSTKTLFTGQYSELNGAVKEKCMWGFREMLISEDRIESNYITPANEIMLNGQRITHPYGKQDGVVIDLPRQ